MQRWAVVSQYKQRRRRDLLFATWIPFLLIVSCLLTIHSKILLKPFPLTEAMKPCPLSLVRSSLSPFLGHRISLRFSPTTSIPQQASSSRPSERRNLHQSCITMMPEGPEVRAVVDQLQGGIGQRLVDVRFVSGRYVRNGPPEGFRAFAATMTPAPGKQRRTTAPKDWFEQSMDDQETAIALEHPKIDIIQEWKCKGKFIYLILDNGGVSDSPTAQQHQHDEDFQRSIWITLGMSGRFLSEKSLQQRHAEGKKNHVRWYFELMNMAGDVKADGTTTKIYYSDMRNFGTLKFCLSRQKLVEKLASLGPDVLSTCTELDFLNVMAGQKNQNMNICKFLMDQSKISGVGNYILAESLYRASIDPFWSLNELSLEQQRTLFREVQAVAAESYSSQNSDADDDDDNNNNNSGKPFEYQCYGQDFCKQRGDPVHREVEGPHGRSIWFTDRQLFLPRAERRSKPMNLPSVQTRSPSLINNEAGAPRKKLSTAGAALTPGNAKLAALLEKTAHPATENATSTESSKKAAIQDKDASAMASSLLSSLREPGWNSALSEQLLKSDSFQKLAVFLEEQHRKGLTVYPPREQIFAALNLCPLEDVKLVIIGQDPYHGGQAHGLAFSVRQGVRPPPSLVNIFKEVTEDVGIEEPRHGNLERWARQGVLLLNTVLTVEAGKANSHSNKGWEEVTDAIIREASERNETVGRSGLLFLLWGNAASKKVGNVIDEDSGHIIIQTSHPSPLGATKTKSPFLGSKCFSRANKALEKIGKNRIDWNVR